MKKEDAPESLYELDSNTTVKKSHNSSFREPLKKENENFDCVSRMSSDNSSDSDNLLTDIPKNEHNQVFSSSIFPLSEHDLRYKLNNVGNILFSKKRKKLSNKKSFAQFKKPKGKKT